MIDTTLVDAFVIRKPECQLSRETFLRHAIYGITVEY